MGAGHGSRLSVRRDYDREKVCRSCSVRDWRLSIDEFRDASEERLLALGTVHFRGRASGIGFDQPLAWLFAFAGERLTDTRTIPDHDQGLEAAGLSE